MHIYHSDSLLFSCISHLAMSYIEISIPDKKVPELIVDLKKQFGEDLQITGKRISNGKFLVEKSADSVIIDLMIMNSPLLVAVGSDLLLRAVNYLNDKYRDDDSVKIAYR